MAIYKIPNGAMPTTAALPLVTTSASLHTMLQVKLFGSHSGLGKVIEWGVSFDGSAAQTPLACELLTTGTVAATITAHAAAGILNWGNPYADVVTDDNPFSFGATNETGFTSSAEGTIVQTQLMDFAELPVTGPFVKQFPLGREPAWEPSDFLRIRIFGDGTIKAKCYVVVEV